MIGGALGVGDPEGSVAMGGLSLSSSASSLRCSTAACETRLAFGVVVTTLRKRELG